MQTNKKQLAVTISFSKRNMDVYNFLQDEKLNEDFNQNDYICKAIRFFEEHKNDKQPLNADYIKALIDQKLLEFKSSILNEISIDKSESINYEDVKNIEEFNCEDD